MCGYPYKCELTSFLIFLASRRGLCISMQIPGQGLLNFTHWIVIEYDPFGEISTL